MGDSTTILKNIYLTAQEGLVSSLMVLPDHIIDVMSMITDDDFDNTICRHIYHAMCAMAIDGGGVESINSGTIQIELEKEGKLVVIGGPATIVSMWEKGALAASRATIDTYARTVKDISAKNRTKEVLTAMQGKLNPDSGTSARAALEDAEHSFTDIMGTLENVKSVANVSDYYSTFVKNLQKRREIVSNADKDDIMADLTASGGIPTGFKTLDETLHGWHRGNVILVAAKTGVGKSICAVDFAINAARSGASVLFFSMEMEMDEIVTRMVSCDTGIPINAIQTGRLDDRGMKKITESQSLLNMKIRVDTSNDMSIDYIRSSTQKMSQSDSGVDLVIIDYIGLIKYHGRSDNRQNQVAEISRSLKEMAMSLDIPVIVLAQLNNRDRGEEADQEPTLAIIRESGAIANDSNVIILLHRKKNDGNDRPEPGQEGAPTKFIIAKNRNGGTGSFLCHSWLWKSQFDEMPKDGSLIGSDDNQSGSNDSTVMPDDDGESVSGDAHKTDDPWASSEPFVNVDDDTMSRYSSLFDEEEDTDGSENA